MKFILTVLAFMLIGMTLNAQDIIIKNNGSEITAKNLEIGQTEVKFKKADNVDGPTYTERTSDLLMIRLEKGGKFVYTNGVGVYTASTPVQNSPPPTVIVSPPNNNQNIVPTTPTQYAQQPVVATPHVAYSTPNANQENACEMGVRDSRRSYTGQNSGKGWAVLFPLAGLVIATTPPAESNLNVPNYEMLKNREYMDCYRSEALKTKKRKVLTSAAIGAGISLLFIMLGNSGS
jgi:hypothetical protein